MDDMIYRKIVSLLEESRQGAVATIVNATPGTPRKLGAKMLVIPGENPLGTIGGGGFEKKIIDEALKVCRSGDSTVINEDLSSAPGGIGAVCGGQVTVFIEPIMKKNKLFVFGAGHVGKAIAEMAQYLDFSLNIIDSRPEWANSDNYPMPCNIFAGDVFKTAEELPADPNSFIIILTHSWKLDESILRRIIKKEYRYLGIIGSKNKIKTHYDNLLEQGFVHGDFRRVYAPIGLEIGAYSPHEIAVSILGEIIAVEKGFRDKLPRWEGAIDLHQEKM